MGGKRNEARGRVGGKRNEARGRVRGRCSGREEERG